MDDRADYIYVSFENGGYAIYNVQTLEILEYSLNDSLPFYDNDSKKYYAGPANYFYKNEKNEFYNVLTNNNIEIPDSKIENLSNQIRKTVTNEKVKENPSLINLLDSENQYIIYKNKSLDDKYSYPEIGSDKLIAGSTKSGYLIPNYKYFISNPTIGKNIKGQTYGNGNSGTCGPVAAQLILGYNNYFNDRRIIEDRFLNGYDDSSNEIIYPESNPNYCTDPMHMTNLTTGTRSESVGANSFYSEIIGRIMKPNTKSSTNAQVKNGIESYLNDYLSSTEYSVNYEEKGWWFGYSSIDTSIIKSELNAGRPIIISMDSKLGGSNHFVVGYGYQDYTYPDGSGTYDGYVVHYGWTGKSCIWINSAWCDGYVSLKINHTHDYYSIKIIPETNRMEYKCSTCGHRTDSAINMMENNRYIERIASLSQGEYKDYYLTFKSGGNKLIQTFGAKDTSIYLFDNEYNLLHENDDDGYRLNSLLSFTAKPNTPYIVRIKFYSSSVVGDIKLGITPASIAYTKYNDIWNGEGVNVSYGFVSSLNTTRVITFTPTESGTYTFVTSYIGESIVDTYLYVIDPYVTNECSYNDDGAGNLQALITMNLVAGRSYFIVVSTYYITRTTGQLTLIVNKET